MSDPRSQAACEVQRLVEANAKSNATLASLVDKVRIDAVNRERKIELLETESRQIRRLLGLVGIAIGLLLTLAVVNAITIQQARRNAAQTAKVARDTASTNKLLFGCLDPTGECSKRNAVEQKRILDEIKQYELTVVYCTRDNPVVNDANHAEFFACVKRLYPTGPALKGR